MLDNHSLVLNMKTYFCNIQYTDNLSERCYTVMIDHKHNTEVCFDGCFKLESGSSFNSLSLNLKAHKKKKHKPLGKSKNKSKKEIHSSLHESQVKICPSMEKNNTGAPKTKTTPQHQR